MIVCDRCANVHATANEYRVAMSRPNPDAERARHARLHETKLELCASCVASVWEVLEKAVRSTQTATVQRTPDPEDTK